MGALQINFWFSVDLGSLAFLTYLSMSFICDLVQLLSNIIVCSNQQVYLRLLFDLF